MKPAEMSEQDMAQSIRGNTCPLSVCVHVFSWTCAHARVLTGFCVLLATTGNSSSGPVASLSSCLLCLSMYIYVSLFFLFSPAFFFSFQSSKLPIPPNPSSCSPSFFTLILTSIPNLPHLLLLQSSSALAKSQSWQLYGFTVFTIRLPYIFCGDT